jgi:hypothetical protein
VVTAVTLGLGVTPAAMGDPAGDPGGAGAGVAVPSQEQVDRARAHAADTARDVGAIKAELILADQRLQQAAVEAEQASEAYNGAMWQLEQATTA